MRSLLLLSAVCAIAAVPRQDDVERYLRAGDAAAARGEWAVAAAWYERAEPITLEPGKVAFNLATARYHLAKAGHLRELAAAEAGYRSCLTGERRARALFGLGNCLLLRAATGGTLDAAMLRAAADRFLECRQADPGLDADARFNEQRARLLLMQAVRRGEAGEEPRGGDDEKEDTTPPPKNDKKAGNADGPGGNEKARMKDAGEGPTVDEKDGKSRAGKGQMTPVPTSSDAPLDATEAGQQVNEAARRIIEEWRANRRQKLKPREGARDW